MHQAKLQREGRGQGGNPKAKLKVRSDLPSLCKEGPLEKGAYTEHMGMEALPLC